jgi:hypothetical protein
LHAGFFAEKTRRVLFIDKNFVLDGLLFLMMLVLMMDFGKILAGDDNPVFFISPKMLNTGLHAT